MARFMAASISDIIFRRTLADGWVNQTGRGLITRTVSPAFGTIPIGPLAPVLVARVISDGKSTETIARFNATVKRPWLGKINNSQKTGLLAKPFWHQSQSGNAF